MSDLLAEMDAALSRVATPAMISRDLNDMQSFKDLDLHEAANLLVMAHKVWGSPPAAAALVLPLGFTTKLQTEVPEMEMLRWREATLYAFNVAYLSSLTLDLQQYRTPVRRLAVQDSQVIVTYQCTRPVEGARNGWEFSRDLLLNVASDVDIRCL